MQKRNFLILTLVVFFHVVKGQIYPNPGVDTLEADVKKAIYFYQQYLDGFKGATLPDFKKYWNKNDLAKYKYPDQMIYGISSDYPTYSMGPSRTILYIKPENDYIHIKTHFGWIDSLKNITTLCITNHYIKFDDEQKPYFINPVEINSKNWQSRTVRNITYYFPPYHRFNKRKADSLILQIQNLEREWLLEPITIRYYFANTIEEIQRLRGFDFSIGMGNRNKPSGISDDRDNLVYCSGWGENYFHEIVHIYLHPKFPNSPLNEGLAAFYGGSMGHKLSWHVNRLKVYLREHPEIDLNKLEDFWKMDNYTNPSSTIQGLICDMAFKKDGISGLKRVMAYKTLNELFEKEYGFKPNELNFGLRKIIDDQ